MDANIEFELKFYYYTGKRQKEARNKTIEEHEETGDNG